MTNQKKYEVNRGFHDVPATVGQDEITLSRLPDEIHDSVVRDSYVQTGPPGKPHGEEEKTESVGLIKLFKFSDKIDVLMLVVGVSVAALAGITQPLNILLFGMVANGFILSARNESDTTPIDSNTADELSDVADTFAIYFCILGSINFVISFIQDWCWCFESERQLRKIRKLLFDSILKQDIAWFDVQSRGELSTRFSEDLDNIKEGMGDKVGVLIRVTVVWFTLGVIALILNWKLAIAALAISPLLILTEAFCAKLLRSISESESNAYAKAGAVAEEAISSVRTVTAFGGQQKECNRYVENLRGVQKTALRKGALLGLCMSSVWSLLYILMAFCFWYGTTLFQEGGYRPGDIITVFIGVTYGAFVLGDGLPGIETLTTARGSAASVYKIIDRKPVVNKSLEKGEEPPTVSGSLRVDNITFNYPSRPNVQVLHDASFDIPSGKRVALVGASGSGKSTMVQLLLRFYDPEKGAIFLDGKDIRTLNLKWYRDQIGVVSQEPVLYATTIEENIRYGAEDVTQNDIEKAAKEANAHDFIMKLPEKYDTVIGTRGQRISGGQKQRIAIARALVKNPKILLLDEATSALDNENEVLVQKALDAAQMGRTTLIVAHRLSTIKNSDQIIVLENGQIMETGSHKDLMEKQDHYYRLITQQAMDGSSGFVEKEYRKDDVGARRQKSRPISISSQEEDSEKGDDASEEILAEERPASLRRLLSLNSPEWPYIVSGCLSCVITGSIVLALAFIFSDFMKVLSLSDPEEQMDQVKFISMISLGIAALMFVTHFAKMLAFVVAGARLTLRLRKKAFEGILRQDIAFFDDPDNQVGRLTTRLSSDAAMVQGATGARIAVVLESLTTIFSTLIVAFVYSWKLTLVVGAFFPVVIAAITIRDKLIKGMVHGDKKLKAEAGHIYSQVIDSITTVASLNAQSQFRSKYDALVDTLYRRKTVYEVRADAYQRSSELRSAVRSDTWKSWKQCVIHGISFAYSAVILYFINAAALRYGAVLVADGEIEFHNVFRVYMVIFYGGVAIGRDSLQAPDFAKARLAAQRILNLIDRVPDIDSYSKDGTVPKACNGEVEIQSLQFCYPSRPDVVVLKDVNLTLKQGSKVALVGQSGCGKSTMVQLLERFYDTASGTISLDHLDIKSLNTSWLRSQIGTVSQEPVLFDCSIADNIAYGDNSRTVSLAEIIQSARSANIHNFIASLPQGYDTNVGARGTQLSGGQKQRVAIARALIRDPKILLFDEATSALDAENEKVVQDALDKASDGRTCIIIAHRLSTIANADQIAVIENGQIEETGTHTELMNKHGKYYELYKSSDFSGTNS